MIKLILRYEFLKCEKQKTVKHILKNELNISERLVKKLKSENMIMCNGVPIYVNKILNQNDVLEVNVDFDNEDSTVLPENIDIDILYEDECLIALNKKPGIIIHPTSSHPTGTLANAISYYLIQKNVHKKVRPVSRLDKDTSGIILFAKNQYVQEHLINQMKERVFIKEYLGIVQGEIPTKQETISLPIGRKPDSIILRQIDYNGSHAITHYELLEKLNNASLLKFKLETGRTHQIRVHCQAIGHPLLGETLYSDVKTELISRQALHSNKVEFIHPLTKIKLELTAPIHDDFMNALDILRM